MTVDSMGVYQKLKNYVTNQPLIKRRFYSKSHPKCIPNPYQSGEILPFSIGLALPAR